MVLFVILLSTALFTAITASGDGECVTNIRDFARLTNADYESGRPFRLEGTVLGATPWSFSIGDGICPQNIEHGPGLKPELRTGDRVRTTGRFVLDADSRHCRVCDSVEILEHGPVPVPVTVHADDLRASRFLGQRGRISGTVTSAYRDEFDQMYNWLVFREQGESFCAAVFSTQFPIEELLRLVDCEVELEGLVTPFSDFRVSNGAFLMLFEKNALRVLKPAAADHFDVPQLSVVGSDRRQRVTGIVTAVTANRFFLASGDRRSITIYPSDATSLPKPGTEVLVAGYSAAGLLGPLMTDVLVKKTADTWHPSEPPEFDLTKAPPDYANPDRTAREYHGRTARIAGVVQPPDEESHRYGRFALISCGRLYQIDVSGFPAEVRDRLRPSATAEISGLCLAEYEDQSFATGFFRFRGFTIIPRTDADIRILANPPWWNVGRMAIALGVLAIALLTILVWNRTLKSRSERRGRQLYHERIEHERASLKVEERTRLAIELHDSISQTLTGVLLQLESAGKANAGGNPAVERFLRSGMSMLSSCRQELRSCLWDLHRRTFEEKDMTEAVLHTVEPHRGNAVITVRFNVERKRLLEPVVHTILRIVRELVANSVRHGNATHVQIAGELREGVIRFSVRDNGGGFDPSTAPGPAEGHFGLSGIRERLRHHRGDLKVESAPGNGTKTTVTMKAEEIEDV